METSNRKQNLNPSYWFCLSFISALCLSFFGHPAYSSSLQSCRQIFGATSLQIESRFSLKKIKVLKKIEASGLDLHDLRIVSSPGDMAEVNLVYKSKNIGYGSLDAVENHQHPGRIHINFISVQESYSGKGLGLLMYLALAKAAYMNGHILESSYDLNANSERV